MLLPVGRSALAIAAGYVALFAVVIFPLAPIALILGILALRDIRRNPERLGKGRAYFAVVVGAFWILLFAVVLLVHGIIRLS